MASTGSRETRFVHRSLDPKDARIEGDTIPLVDDHREHHIEIRIGSQLTQGIEDPSREPAALAISPDLAAADHRQSKRYSEHIERT